MARTGLEYFPLDTMMDDKVGLLEAELGLKGFAVFVHLLQKIYGQAGYYCGWDKDVALMFSRQCGEGGSVVSEVVNCALRRGIFNNELFEKFGILTSHGIQKRYLEAAKRRKEIVIENEYLLVHGVEKMENVRISSKNVCISSKNVCRNQQSKVKESKVKESKYKPPSGVDLFEDQKIADLWDEYIELRKSLKFILTERSVNALIKKLKSFPQSEWDEILDSAITQGWKSFYPTVNMKNAQRIPQNPISDTDRLRDEAYDDLTKHHNEWLKNYSFDDEIEEP